MAERYGTIGMFVELAYRKTMPSLAQNNGAYTARALEVFPQASANKDWMCDTVTTMGSTYNLLTDDLFAFAISECGAEVFQFASQFGVTRTDLRCVEGWLNIAMPGQYQEFHRHPMSHFSVVYYVQTPENCGDIVFRSAASESDMFPLPTPRPEFANAKTHREPAVAGDMLIFRSNMAHMVMKNQSNEPRISLALNYIFP